VSIRRARPEDVAFVEALLTHAEVEPFLAAAGTKTSEALLDELRVAESDPAERGRFVIEADGATAGTMAFHRTNRRSRIAKLGGLAVHPDFRGRRLADEAALLFVLHLFDEIAFHRLELEIYGFNERAIAHAERIGFVREGVRRRAYERHGEWVDGVLLGLLPEDLG
jgi:L-phenylalanine/L-methionine N-acetyltransferase